MRGFLEGIYRHMVLRVEFREITRWMREWIAPYPDCFADWEPRDAFAIALQITDVGNQRRAFESYTKWKEEKLKSQQLEELYGLHNVHNDISSDGSYHCKCGE